MSAILAYVNINIATNVAVFVATLLFSQKIKDFFTGVPSSIRAGLNQAEANLRADVETYTNELVAKVAPKKVTALPGSAAPPGLQSAPPAA